MNTKRVINVGLRWITILAVIASLGLALGGNARNVLAEAPLAFNESEKNIQLGDVSPQGEPQLIPWMDVILSGRVEARDFPRDTHVTIEVLDQNNILVSSLPCTAVPDSDPRYTRCGVNFASGTLVTSRKVRVSGGGTTLELIIPEFTVNVDLENNQLSGTGPVDGMIESCILEADNNCHVFLSTQVDGQNHWMIPYGTDITASSRGRVDVQIGSTGRVALNWSGGGGGGGGSQRASITTDVNYRMVLVQNFPLGAMVHLKVENGAVNVFETGSGTYPDLVVVVDPHGGTIADFRLPYWVVFNAGMTVTATATVDGTLYQMSMTIVPLQVTGITGNQISGTAIAGSKVFVCLDTPDFIPQTCNTREAIADETGHWSVDYATGSDPVTLGPGNHGHARVLVANINDYDEWTRVSWAVMSPYLDVYLPNTVQVVDWPARTLVNVEIYNAYGTLEPSYTRSCESTLESAGVHTRCGVDLPQGAIAPHKTIKASGDGKSVTLEIPVFSLDSLNLVQNTISGTAPKDADVSSCLNEGSICKGELSLVTASDIDGDGDGDWSFHFQKDITEIDKGQVSLQQGLNFVRIRWYSANPWIDVTPSSRVEARDFPNGTPVTIKVFASANDTSPIRSENCTANPDSNPQYTRCGYDFGQGVLVAGRKVTVSGGIYSRELVIPVFSAGPVDVQNDRISGSTPAEGGLIESCLFAPNTNAVCTTFSVTGNTWTVDFGKDIGPGDAGRVSLKIGNNKVGVSWSIPIPKITIFPPGGIEVRDWPVNTTGRFEFDLPETDWAPDSISSCVSSILSGSSTPICSIRTRREFFAPGSHIMISGGSISQEVVMPGFTVDRIDIDSNEVKGTAPAGMEITASLYNPQVNPITFISQNTVISDQNGWRATFSDIPAGYVVHTSLRYSSSVNVILETTAPISMCESSSISGQVNLTGKVFGSDIPWSPATTVSILTPGRWRLIKTVPVNADGTYSADVAPGKYIVYADASSTWMKYGRSFSYSRTYYQGPTSLQVTTIEVAAGSCHVTGVDINLQEPGFTNDRIEFNFNKPIIQDLNVRKAIAHAVNRPKLIADYAPYSPLLDSITPASSVNHPVSGLPIYQYDPVLARAILEAGGWIDPGTGIRVKNGNPLSLVLIATVDRFNVAKQIADDLRDVGFEININPYSETEYYISLASPIRSRSYDLAIYTLAANLNGDYTAIFNSSVTNYNNPVASDLIKAANSSLPYETQRSKWQQHQVILMNDVAILPLYWHVAVDSDLDGQLDQNDPCPADALNACTAIPPTTEIISTAGGVVETPDQVVSITIPENALSAPVNIQIAPTGGNFSLAYPEGTLLVANSFTVTPHGQTFTIPVTLTLSWVDADNNGWVDGTSIAEANLLVVKNGGIISQPCGQNPDCDMINNRISVDVSSFSQILLGQLQSPLQVSAHAGGPYTVFAGAPLQLDASQSLGNNLTYAWDLDGDKVYTDAVGVSPSVTFAQAGVYSVTVKVTDAAGHFSFASASVIVMPVLVLNPISAPVDPVRIGIPVNTSMSFTPDDPVSNLTAKWDWGDGTKSDGSINVNTINGSHVYTKPGVYTLRLELSYYGVNFSEAVFNYVVVYDPDGGFVTGGGWINSPAGAYAADLTLTGKASFGFVARYKKGANIPEGNTQFEFKVAGLSFHSTAYDWLVVAGSKAQYKGVGTINGQGNYGFMLSAVDGSLKQNSVPDTFRIKIWDRLSGQTVYDNQLGASDTDEPNTVLGGGSIVIHK